MKRKYLKIGVRKKLKLKQAKSPDYWLISS